MKIKCPEQGATLLRGVFQQPVNLPTKLIERFVNFLEPIGWTCIGLDTGGDEFCIFIVKTGVYPDILDTATRFEISITDKPHRM